MAKNIRIFNMIFLFLMFFNSAGIVVAEEVLARAIYLDKAQDTLGLKFYVSLIRDGKSMSVPTTYSFKTGDRVSLSVESNKDCFVYILNRTFAKNQGPGQTRKIVLKENAIDKVNISEKVSEAQVAQQPSREQAGRFRLLFPSKDTGINNHLKSKTLHSVPSSGQFIFDQKKGVERIYVVASKAKFSALEDIVTHINSGSNLKTRSFENDIDYQRKLSKVIEDLRARSIVNYANNNVEYAGYGVVKTRGIKLNNKSQEVVLITANLKHD